MTATETTKENKTNQSDIILSPHYQETGYCRYYYKSNIGSSIFCFQDEGNGVVMLYRCTYEGEPECELRVKKDIQIILPPEEDTDELSNTIREHIIKTYHTPVKTKELRMFGDRYVFDNGRCSRENGYIVMSSGDDCSYYGHWINPFTYTIVSYVEGDVHTTVCHRVEDFKKELKTAFYWLHDHTNYAHLCSNDDEMNKQLEKLELAYLI